MIILLATIAISCNGNAQHKNPVEGIKIKKTDKEWKKELSAKEYHVLRQAGTERAFSSKYNHFEEKGTFVCAACGNELYSSENKFDSGTGWPSFDRAVKNDNVVYRPDGGAQEVLCANCGGHLGHMFHDGPARTTGKRHCINGVALNFVASKK